MRFLIVEDEWLIADRIEQTLVGAGYVVVAVAGTVSKALAAIDNGAFDRVVLDANLGGESAEQVADRLVAGKIPFIVVSGNAGRERPGHLGTAPFLRKPFNSSDLLKLIVVMPLDETRQKMSSNTPL